MFAQFLELGDQRREVAVAGDDGEGVDVFLGVGKVHGIDAQTDVGGVLAAGGPPRNLDQLDGRLVQGRRVRREAAPVSVSLFADDLAFLDEALDDARDVELVAPALKAERQVLEVDENG